jgi:hypothetical protein
MRIMPNQSKAVITRMQGRAPADVMLTVRLPKADLRWLKIYGAAVGQPMTAVAQQMIKELRARHPIVLPQLSEHDNEKT